MRKSGKRFNSQNSITQTVSVDAKVESTEEGQTENEVSSFAKKEKKMVEVVVGV